jgi:hypothetical protein
MGLLKQASNKVNLELVTAIPPLETLRTVSSANLTMTLSPWRVAQAMTAVAVLLTLLSLSAHWLQYVAGRDHFVEYSHFVNLGDEKNLPTWYSSMILMASSFLLAYIGQKRRRQLDQNWRSWINMAVIFAFLSLDEIVTIHDKIIETPLIEWLHPTGFWAFPWVIVGWIGVSTFGLAFRRFLGNLPADTRLLFITAGAVFVTGALVLEMVSAYLMDFYVHEIIIRGLVATIQEFMEMFGIVIFIYALLVYIGSHLHVIYSNGLKGFGD